MINPKLIMTSSQRQNKIDLAGMEMADKLGIEVVPRERRAIDWLLDEYNADGVIVWQESGPILHLDGQKFFFHPSMAKARISMLRKDLIIDPMLQAMEVKGGDNVLDCTLGLGADAIVAAYAAGPEGQVLGLEKVPVLAVLVAYGLAHYRTDMKSLQAAIQRIKVVNQEHHEYLQLLADKSFDIVYFDPMFRKPVVNSTGIKPLRLLAEGAPLQPESVREAVRVARKRVVVKERNGSTEFERLGCQRILGSTSSPVAYGIIEVGR
ncbi:MAG: class I SAM-dependent methyltransferase [Methylocystaceae bacterium]